jgi:hypothetical protein
VDGILRVQPMTLYCVVYFVILQLFKNRLLENGAAC